MKSFFDKNNLKTLFFRLTEKQKEIINIIIVSLIAIIFFLFLYSEILNPKYDAWLLTSGPDPAQHYIGWMMYKSAPWSFPIGVANNYAYPVGLPITYTDSIPLLAVIFKLFRNFIPENFQYFGLWLLFCFVLQAIFGYLLIKIFIKSNIIAILGSALFLLSPIMLFNNFALAGHWLLLMGLWLVFKKHISIQWWQWSLLFFLSLFVHPYLFFMNGFLMIADLTMLYFVYDKIKKQQVFLFFIFEAAWSLLIIFSLGLFRGEAYKYGYGDFSMNLNALFNPADNWSNIVPILPLGQYQLEGFNYLGLGIIFLSTLSLYFSLYKKELFLVLKKYWPILLTGLVLTILAVSNVVVFNNIELINIKLPSFIVSDILGTIRSSGRMFWPVFYIILLFSFYVFKKISFKKSIFILIMVIIIQFFDLSHKMNQLNVLFEGKKWSNPIETKEWVKYSKNYKHIFFLPVIPHVNYIPFTLYAAKNNLTVNNGYFARGIKKLDDNIREKIEKAEKGKYDCDTIYIFSKDIEHFYSNINLNEHLLTPIYKAHILYPCYNNF